MPPSDSTVTSGDLTKLCNHKRKLLAMAALAAGPGFNSQQQQQVHGTQGSGDMQLPKAKKGKCCIFQSMSAVNVRGSRYDV
jgi:hypothetical protein